MTDRIAGRVGPHRESHEPTLDVRNFSPYLPDTTGEWQVGASITDWLMLGNDQYGDCGAAATDHAFIAQDGVVSDRLGTPKYPGTLATYFAYGVAQGEPGPTPDQGVDNATWLAWLYKSGIIKGYAEVPVSHINHYAKVFAGALLGLYFDASQAIAQFNEDTAWTAMPRRDGHDVLYAGYLKVVTWGRWQALAPGFLNANATDAWVIVDPDDPSVDGPSLRAALEYLHGVVPAAPSVAPPVTPVPPSPSPATGPPGGLEGLTARLETALHRVETWLTGLEGGDT